MKNLLKPVIILCLLFGPGTIGYYFHETILGPIMFLISFIMSLILLIHLKKRWNIKMDSRIRDEHSW
jgi:uncharacterized membrane protein